MSEEETPRRNFLNFLLGGATLAFLGAVFYPVFRYIIPPESGTVSVNQVKLPFTKQQLVDSKSKFKTFKFGQTLGIILVDDKGKLHAMSAVCTHLQCTVRYRADWGVIWCPCHNGRYSLTGQVISGPPPKPLQEYKVSEVKGQLFVSKENA
jgi:Rieske Fe-S protein